MCTKGMPLGKSRENDELDIRASQLRSFFILKYHKTYKYSFIIRFQRIFFYICFSQF
jgi:hypothetical protein